MVRRARFAPFRNAQGVGSPPPLWRGAVPLIDGTAIATAIEIQPGTIVLAGTKPAGWASRSSSAIFFVADCRTVQQTRWSLIEGIGMEQEMMPLFIHLGSAVHSSTG